MKILGVIPARYDSSRFPGKPLADIMGKTMIRRVVEQVQKCPLVDDVIVATDDNRIAENVLSSGGKVIMTGKNHRSGTDRIGEVLEKLEAEGKSFDIIINIQGDEPFIDPKQIEEVISLFRDPGVQIATLAKKITSHEEVQNPNVVKVVFGKSGQALYFSRSPIPYVRTKTDEASYYKHVGMYAYKTEILRQLVSLKSSPLEHAESLEQLRWLENGYEIHVHITEFESVAIDTPEDLKKLTNNP
jgi:3-deoxy-manno-octulosonate cytidylyltransferase (CMP-KDO synthetase)